MTSLKVETIVQLLINRFLFADIVINDMYYTSKIGDLLGNYDYSHIIEKKIDKLIGDMQTYEKTIR